MNSQERITYRAFVIKEFLSQVLKVAESSLVEEQFEKLKYFLNKLLSDENEVFHQVEKLAQIPDTTELTIFFSDLLERLDYDDPYDVLDSFESVIGDYITLTELLLEEPEYVAAINEYIKDMEMFDQVAKDELEEQELIAQSIENDIKEEEAGQNVEELVEIEATEEIVAPQDPLGFIDFVFAELLKKVAQDKQIKKNTKLLGASQQYITHLRDNFKRKPNLLRNQPQEKAVEIAELLIDRLSEPDKSIIDNYFPFMDEASKLLIAYTLDNEEDLLKSYTGVLPELTPDDSGVEGEGEDRKVLQKQIYSYFEKETEFHINQLKVAIENEQYNTFWIELEALKTLVMIHGYEAIETACLRLHKENEQWELDEVNTFLKENADGIVHFLGNILHAEISKESDKSRDLLDQLDDLIFSGFSQFEAIAIDKELIPVLKKIWLDRFSERKLSDLDEWIKIDYDNGILLGLPEEFLDGINVVSSFLETNPLIPTNWEEFYKSWVEIFSNEDVELLTERVNHSIDRSTGAILSYDQQDALVPEIFKQIHKRFSDLAPYYQLTDDEQAYFQQQVSELSAFIQDESYKSYVEKLLGYLNEYFYEEFSDVFVKKYMDRISKPLSESVFPLEDLILPTAKPEEKKIPEKKDTDEEWIAEVESGVSFADDDEYVAIFKTEAVEYLGQIKSNIPLIISGDENVLAETENLVHNISSSAGMVGLSNTSQLALLFEDVLDELKRQGTKKYNLLPEDGVKKLLNEIEQIASNPSLDKDLDVETIFAGINKWKTSLSETLKADQIPEEKEEITTDPEMLEVFQTEAGQNVETILENLKLLLNDPGDVQAIGKIITPAHDIMSAAKMLGFAQIGDLMAKIESFAEETAKENIAVEQFQVNYLHSVISDIQKVMDGKLNENRLDVFLNDFEQKMSNQVEDRIVFDQFISNYFSNEINNLIGRKKEEADIRAFASAAIDNIQNKREKDTYAKLLNAPLEDWSGIVSAFPAKQRKNLGASGGSVALQNTDMLLDSSAAMVDSHLEMQDQLNRNRELLTELNSTQNLLNYLKAELDELDQSSETGAEIKKRRVELSRILNDAVAKMNHLVQEMGRANSAFETRLTDFDNLSNKFQRNILEARKIPAAELLERLKGLIDMLGDSTGKLFDVQFSGEQIELDVSTIDFLEKPLKELLINSVYHGIEDSADRIAAGKTDRGKISINLSRKRNLIQLEFHDDGIGLDLKAIAEKAKQLNYDKVENDEQLVDLLFSEDFSLAKKKDDFVGDGQGLAELRKVVETIRGDINIDSETGVYTTISLVFPQHLKITDAAVVQAEKDYFAIPLGVDDETLKIRKRDVVESSGNLSVNFKGSKYPAFHFNDVVHLEKKSLGGSRLSAIRFVDGDLNLFMIVDHLREVETIVIRPLQQEVKNLSFIAGVAQLPNFQTVLVMETDALLKEVEYQKTNLKDGKEIPAENIVDENKTSDYSHGVVFSSSQYSADIIANVLRERSIETELITDVMEWTEDIDQADILFADLDAYDELKQLKGLWLDSPDMIIVMHDGEADEIPSGADLLLLRPFNEDDIVNIISG